MPEAQVPGFRAGRAPRKLVEHRFRKEVKDQVKSNLLMDSMAQVTDDQKLAAISEPDFDLAAVEVPDDGPMTFEFDIEVRPEFDMPNGRADVERPTREFTEKDVDAQLQQLAGSARPAGAVRRRRRRRAITFSEHHVQRWRERAVENRRANAVHPAHVELPRRQDRKIRQADGRRQSGRNSRGQGQALRRCAERGPARQNHHRRVRSAGSQEARTCPS